MRKGRHIFSTKVKIVTTASTALLAKPRSPHSGNLQSSVNRLEASWMCLKLEVQFILHFNIILAWCWKTIAGVHLPDNKLCSLLFLHQLVEGSKKMIPWSRMPAHLVPQWPDLAVKNFSGHVLGDEALKDYFPDKFRSGKQTECDCFWGVLHAVKQSYAKAPVSQAMVQRNQHPQAPTNDERDHVVVKDTILRQIMDAP